MTAPGAPCRHEGRRDCLDGPGVNDPRPLIRYLAGELVGVEFVVDGMPEGKGRPRAGRRGRKTILYTPAATEAAELRVRVAFLALQVERFDEGPLHLDVEAVLPRPESHYRVGGELSAPGLRSPWPTRKPDLDNVAKLVCDALNGTAYRDDAQIVSLRGVRRWANPGEGPHTRVAVRRVDDHDLTRAA